jgi:hypothetical protein
MKRTLSMLVLALFIAGLLTAAVPLPTPFTTLLRNGLPAVMNVGEKVTVDVDVTGDQPFLGVQVMSSFAYPGKSVFRPAGSRLPGKEFYSKDGERRCTCLCSGRSPLPGRLCC